MLRLQPSSYGRNGRDSEGVAQGETGGRYPFHAPISLWFIRNKDSEPAGQMKGLVLFLKFLLRVETV